MTEEALEYAEGEPADTGYVFYNRCPFAEEEWSKPRPPLTELTPGHVAACLFPERVPTLKETIQGGRQK
jgi:hypothetical protein